MCLSQLADLNQDYDDLKSTQLEEESRFELPEGIHAQSGFYSED